MDLKIKTQTALHWSYTTDDLVGQCIIAKERMVINFKFESAGMIREFYDVLEIDHLLQTLLEQPISVEGIVDDLAKQWPNLEITARGRAASHGWITANAMPGQSEIHKANK